MTEEGGKAGAHRPRLWTSELASPAFCNGPINVEEAKRRTS